MTKGKIITIGILALILLSLGWTCNLNNRWSNDEEDIIGAKENTRNIHAVKLVKGIKAAGLPVREYEKTLLQALQIGMEGRYGETGSRAAMQWIKEQHPNIDTKLFIKLQQIIEANINEFANAQTDLLDRCKVYKASMRHQPNKMIARLLGFPQLDLDKYCSIVTSAETKADFAAGELSDIDVFGDAKGQ